MEVITLALSIALKAATCDLMIAPNPRASTVVVEATASTDLFKGETAAIKRVGLATDMIMVVLEGLARTAPFRAVEATGRSGTCPMLSGPRRIW